MVSLIPYQLINNLLETNRRSLNSKFYQGRMSNLLCEIFHVRFESNYNQIRFLFFTVRLILHDKQTDKSTDEFAYMSYIFDLATLMEIFCTLRPYSD